jgi:hypothetical protein
MTEQTAAIRGETWYELLKAVKSAAPTADPEELKDLAEAYELLMRHA